MPKWPWLERPFVFAFPVNKWPDLLERVRGTPARIEERVARLDRDVLTRRLNDTSWSIQENIGHLIDLSYLPLTRIDQILRGEKVLIATDPANKKTHEARHNDRAITDLLAEFRAERARLVARFEGLAEEDWGRSALHPRLNQPMRIVDIAYFDAEHDDYHLGRIGDLIRAFSSSR